MLWFKDWRPEDIESIQAPTLLMIGDAGSVRPEHALEMFRLLRHARLAVFPGGHGAYIGEVTAAAIKDSQVQFGVVGSSSKEESKLPEMVVAVIEEFLDAPMTETKASKATCYLKSLKIGQACSSRISTPAISRRSWPCTNPRPAS
jgi:hypothetical protein